MTLTRDDHLLLRRVAREIREGVRMAHGQRPPEGVPGARWTQAAESAWKDAERLDELADRLLDG